MKKGITLTALVIYLVLFFGFTAFVVTITSKYNEKVFIDRGVAVNITELNKLEYNLTISKSKSSSFSKIGANIVFDNNDIYSYDSNKKAILFNNGILISNVDACTFTVNSINKGTHLVVNITLKKYLSTINRDIELFMEV